MRTKANHLATPSDVYEAFQTRRRRLRKTSNFKGSEWFVYHLRPNLPTILLSLFNLKFAIR